MTVTNSEELKESFEAIKVKLKGSRVRRVDQIINPVILECDYESKTATVRYNFEEFMSNYSGNMHGGFSSLIMDSGMGWLSCAYIGEIVNTISLNVSYEKPVAPAEHVIGKFRIKDIKRHVIFTEGCLIDPNNPDGELVHADGIYYRLENR